MSTLVYRIYALLSRILARVPIGTNLGLFHLLLALLTGRFLHARGAVFPTLASLGLTDVQVRRSEAALRSGRWDTSDLLDNWQKTVSEEGCFVACEYEGIQPVACDLTAFFRPQLRSLIHKERGLGSKHYVSATGKALPAIVFGLSVSVGRVGNAQSNAQSNVQSNAQSNAQSNRQPQTRLGLPRLLLRRAEGESEAALQKRLIAQTAKTLAPKQALVVDAGFSLPTLLEVPGLPFVARVRSNQTARRSTLPTYKGRGRRPTRGELVRPLAGTRKGQPIEATVPDATAHWTDGKHTLRAEIWNALVLPDAKPDAKPETFRLVAISDPRYPAPLLLTSNLPVSASALWHLYRDRWAIEQVPLAAKPMLGAERAFVFGQESRYRLPELALLAGNLLSYIAATEAPVASGFWDRAARPTCGRVRRFLCRANCLANGSTTGLTNYSKLSIPHGQLRKKESVTAHLKTGIEGHRRQKPMPTLPTTT